jgi:hypothetical protein
MNVEYLEEQLQVMLRRVTEQLEDIHKVMREVLDELPHTAAGVIQSFWRDLLQRAKVRRTQALWEQRHRRWKQSKEVWPGRKSMIMEDWLSRRFRDMTYAATLLQRLYRQVRSEKISAELAGLSLMERRRIEREKREDEEFQRRYRAELESQKKLAAWKCHICEKKRYPHPKLPYKSWKLVEEHLAGHTMLQDMKEEKRRKHQMRFEYRLDKEKAHIRQLRRQRILKERGRHVFALVLCGISQKLELHKSELEKLVESRKRARAMQELRIQAAQEALDNQQDQETKDAEDEESRQET